MKGEVNATKVLLCKEERKMGVTSSGLLDEERDASAASMSAREVDSPDNTLTESGEDELGTNQVCYRGPCKYQLP